MTEIFVSDENTLDAETINMRPAISITRGPIQFVTLGFDDMLGYNSATGQKKKGVLVPGTMSINCCSRSDLESENLAWIIAENLWMNRDMLMQYGFFEVGRSPSISAPSPAGSLVQNDSGKEWYATSVTCPFQFYRTGQITPLGKAILDGIDMRLRTGATPVPQQGVPYGYAVEGERPPPFSTASDADGNSPNAGAEQAALPRVPNPMNPAQLVTVRHIRPGQQAVRGPSIYGRLLPITTPSVEESPLSVELESTVKV